MGLNPYVVSFFFGVPPPRGRLHPSVIEMPGRKEFALCQGFGPRAQNACTAQKRRPAVRGHSAANPQSCPPIPKPQEIRGSYRLHLGFCPQSNPRKCHVQPVIAACFRQAAAHFLEKPPHIRKNPQLQSCFFVWYDRPALKF